MKYTEKEYNIFKELMIVNHGWWPRNSKSMYNTFSDFIKRRMSLLAHIPPAYEILEVIYKIHTGKISIEDIPLYIGTPLVTEEAYSKFLKTVIQWRLKIGR